MKSEVMFNYDYLFGDHMAKVSHQAVLYYIKLMFFANNGFVSNPMEVLDSLGYDKTIYYELLANGEILSLPERSEIFITSYFIHNHFKPMSWLSTPFAVYWKGKLFIKKNGVATFTPQAEDETQKTEQTNPADQPEESEKKKELKKCLKSIVELQNDKEDSNLDWDAMLDDIEAAK